jgi:hypothetical protein
VAKNKDQWFSTLKSWVPEWFFEVGVYSTAAFYEIAAVFAELETEVDDQIRETFILQSDGAFTDEHGLERNLTRGAAETDLAYQVRIQRILNTTNIPALKSAIEAILIVGCAKVIDNELDQPFFDDEAFFDRAQLATPFLKNFFTVWINPQVLGELDSFYDEEEFFDLQAFFSSSPLDEQEYVYSAIVDLINKNKALGTMYEVLITNQNLCA